MGEINQHDYLGRIEHQGSDFSALGSASDGPCGLGPVIFSLNPNLCICK